MLQYLLDSGMGPKYLSVRAIGFQVVKTGITSLTWLCMGGQLLKQIKWITLLRSGEHRGHRYYLNDVELLGAMTI